MTQEKIGEVIEAARENNRRHHNRIEKAMRTLKDPSLTRAERKTLKSIFYDELKEEEVNINADIRYYREQLREEQTYDLRICR